MATEHTEIERKFDVEETFVVPDLSGVPGVASVGEPVVHELAATYYDTADLRLARAKITLRRRTGGTDEGWHLKLPAEAGARRELHSPLGRAIKAPPRATLAPVLGVVRRAPAAQVATLATRRTLTTLLAEDGRVLAEVADDQVTGTALPATPGEAVVVITWREVEVELVDGDEELLSAVGAELEVSGAQPSASAAKLARVLADRLAGPPPSAVQDEADDEDDDGTDDGTAGDGTVAVDPGDEAEADGPDTASVPEEPLPDGKKARAKEVARRAQAAKEAEKQAAKARKQAAKAQKQAAKAEKQARKQAEADAAERARLAAIPKAGDVVVAALATQLDALQRADLMVRTDVPDGVHQVRVAARRLRSILAAYRPVLDRTRTDAVRDELQWLGQELSGTRDAEVSIEHLRELVAAQPVEFVLGPVAARLQQAELQGESAGTGHAVATLSLSRYLTLLDTLHALVAQPPLTALAAEPAEEVLAAVLRRTVKRLQALVDVAEDAEFAEDAAARTGAGEHGVGEHGAAESPYDLALHEVRKAGKRVRYTAEVAAPVLDGGKKKNGAVMGVVDAMKQLQDVLGDRQDTVVTRELCRTVGLAAFAAGENAWTYGRLHALEEMRAMQYERDFWALWPTLAPVLNGVTRKR